MIDVIKRFFDVDDYKYLLDNISPIDENKYRLRVSVSFYVNKAHYNTRGFLSNEEICKLINSDKSGAGYLLYCYEKIGVIKGFSLCKEKTEEQLEFYEKMKGSEHWDYRIKTDCFDYEIDGDIKKLQFFGDSVFENTDYGTPTRCLSDLVSIIESLAIKYDEILDFLKIQDNNPHHYKNIYLIIFSIGNDPAYLDRLFDFIEIIASEHEGISKRIEILKKLIIESGKNGIYISGGILKINLETIKVSGDQRLICEEIFRNPGKHIKKTELMNAVYGNDESDKQMDEQIKKINSNKIYPNSAVGGIRQESGYVYYDKDYIRK